MNARRIRNMAKIVAVALIDQYLRDGCEPDERLAEGAAGRGAP